MKKALTGNLKVELKGEGGKIVTKDHGFTIQEEQKVLSFDKIDRPEDYGTVLLFGDQVYFIKYWDDEDIERALALTKEVFEGELERRKNE
jgi:hypothetical protein